MDCNTSYFHRVASGRRNRNHIGTLVLENGVRTSNDKETKEEILLAFSKLYSPTIPEKLFVEGIEWSPISSREDEELVALFTLEEIRKAVFSSDRNKSPGLDDFTMAFFSDNWNLVKGDLEGVFKEFFKRGILNRSIVETFVCLIPKKENAIRVKESRPISLITNVYKILAKVLANRLRKVMPSTIFKLQGAFLAGRQILDQALIANKAIEDTHMKKKDGVVLKLDFLDKVMMKKGFGFRCRMGMWGCIRNVQYSILINGTLKGSIQASRGLRQGDPLSPFLFLLVVDVLSQLIVKGVEGNIIEPFRVSSNEVTLSHTFSLLMTLSCFVWVKRIPS